MRPGTTFDPIPPAINEISRLVRDAAYRIHDAVGPACLESVYARLFEYELEKQRLPFIREIHVPVTYDGRRFHVPLRADFLVDRKVVVELKAVDEIHPVHVKQVLSYLQLTGCRLGILLNFNAPTRGAVFHRYVL